MKKLTIEDYTICVVCTKPVELRAVRVMLDEQHEEPNDLTEVSDDNHYVLGSISGHNVVIAGPPYGSQGKVETAAVANGIKTSFPSIKAGLLVGIGGGIPSSTCDIRLGDVVVGSQVVQYDLGKETSNGFKTSGTMNKPSRMLSTAVSMIASDPQEENSFFSTYLKRFESFSSTREKYFRPSEAHRDRLFRSGCAHTSGNQSATLSGSHCEEISRVRRDPLDIHVHIGTILSGDRVIKSSERRDALAAEYPNAKCFEMEAAGMMDTIPCLVIRGISDYSDAHKNDDWHGYAAATAACYARKILCTIQVRGTTFASRSNSRKSENQKTNQGVVVGGNNFGSININYNYGSNRH